MALTNINDILNSSSLFSDEFSAGDSMDSNELQLNSACMAFPQEEVTMFPSPSSPTNNAIATAPVNITVVSPPLSTMYGALQPMFGNNMGFSGAAYYAMSAFSESPAADSIGSCSDKATTIYAGKKRRGGRGGRQTAKTRDDFPSDESYHEHLRLRKKKNEICVLSRRNTKEKVQSLEKVVNRLTEENRVLRQLLHAGGLLAA